MMHHDISPEGAATDRLARNALMHWEDAAAIAGVDMEGFAPNASSDDLRTWALSKGLDIGTIYARFSTKMQQSTEDQVREVIIWAARNGVFVPPALICVDEADRGYGGTG